MIFCFSLPATLHTTRDICHSRETDTCHSCCPYSRRSRLRTLTWMCALRYGDAIDRRVVRFVSVRPPVRGPVRTAVRPAVRLSVTSYRTPVGRMVAVGQADGLCQRYPSSRPETGAQRRGRGRRSVRQRGVTWHRYRHCCPQQKLRNCYRNVCNISLIRAS